MSDLTSRHVAIDAWKEDFKGFVNSLDMPRDDYKGIMEYIDEVPSAQLELPIKEKCTVCPHCDNCDVNDDGTIAQPERMPGKWIYDGDCYICNQCKSAFSWWADSQTSNYCPNCGARMDG